MPDKILSAVVTWCAARYISEVTLLSNHEMTICAALDESREAVK